MHVGYKIQQERHRAKRKPVHIARTKWTQEIAKGTEDFEKDQMQLNL